MLTFGPITNASTDPTAAQTYNEHAAGPRAAILVYEGTFNGVTITPQIQSRNGDTYVADTDGEATEPCRRVIYLIPGESIKFVRTGAGASTSVTVRVY